MENIIFYRIICASFLIILVLCIIGGIIRKDVNHIGDILAENQQKLSRQIDRKYNDSKENSKWLSSYERGRIDDIILALTTLGNEKLISYTEEINFLLKIRNW